MRVKDFELLEPVPVLRQPHVVSSLRPWLDAGGVGTLGLARLERHLGAQDLGSLATPGLFFDFTRYRPMLYYVEGQRHSSIPNARVRFAKGPGDFDFIFLHLLEPHSNAEQYIESIAALFEQLNVKRHCRIGGMYDAVPHTRPLPVMGSLDGEDLAMAGVHGVTSLRGAGYQGPTSIMNLLAEKVGPLGVENMTLMVRLPQYVQLEEDYNGAARLLNVLCSIYDLPDELSTSRRGQRQYERVSAEMERNAGVRALVERLESDYDSKVDSSLQEETITPLSPAIEEFLRDLGSKMDNP
jgi:hypothetical protein